MYFTFSNCIHKALKMKCAPGYSHLFGFLYHPVVKYYISLKLHVLYDNLSFPTLTNLKQL